MLHYLMCTILILHYLMFHYLMLCDFTVRFFDNALVAVAFSLVTLVTRFTLAVFSVSIVDFEQVNISILSAGRGQPYR